MFGDDTSPTQLGQAATVQYGTVPPYQVTNAPNGDVPLFQINRGNGSVTTVSVTNGGLTITNSVGGITVGGSSIGGINIGGTNIGGFNGGGGFQSQFDGGQTFNPGVGQQTGGGGGGGGSGGNVFNGKVMSYLGDNVYSVAVYFSGTGLAPTTVNVLQLNGDPDFPHLADGTFWAVVTKIGAEYTMQLPVWE